MGPKSNTAKKASGLSGAPNSERANNRREIAAAKKAEEEREQTALEEQITVLEQLMRERKIKFHSFQNLHPYEDYDPRSDPQATHTDVKLWLEERIQILEHKFEEWLANSRIL